MSLATSAPWSSSTSAMGRSRQDSPETTFGNIKADVPAHFVPGFVRGDLVEKIKNSDWPQ